VRIWETNAAKGIHRSAVSRGNFADWRTMATSFEIMGAFSGPTSRVVQFGSGEPEIVRMASGTADFMRVMGVEPAIRNPEGGDQFISHAFWMRRFGGDPAAASGALVFEGHALAIGGVMPRGFDFPAGADVWGLMSFGEERASRDVNVIARLRKDRTIAEARAELRTIAAALAAAHPAENAGWDVEIEPLQSTIVADAASTLWLLHAAVSLTLLIAVINVGGLFLAHAVGRRREIAVRLALGAPARRLLGQQALEAALLVTAGTLGALAVGSALIQIMLSLAPPTLPRLHEIGFSAPALYAAAVLAALMVALFTVVTARALRPDASELLAGQRAAGGPTARLGRGFLTVSQVAFCVVLLVLSSVVVGAFVKLLRVDTGFVAANVLAAQVRQPVLKAGEVVKHYPTRRFARIADQLVEEALALPGVETAAVSWYPPAGRAGAPVQYLPLSGPSTGPRTGAPPVTGPDARPAILNTVSPDDFRTLRIPILHGRPFTADDRLRDDQIDDWDAPRGAGVAIVKRGVRQAERGWTRGAGALRRRDLGVLQVRRDCGRRSGYPGPSRRAGRADDLSAVRAGADEHAPAVRADGGRARGARGASSREAAPVRRRRDGVRYPPAAGPGV
jgi:putative ABC transport system permease protein